MNTENIFLDEEDFDELKNSASKLFSLDRKLPFEVPADYFDELPMLIQERCAQENTHKISVLEKIIFLMRRKYIAFGILILLMSGGYFFYLSKNGVQKSAPSTDEITTALTDNLSVDDETLLIESMPDNKVASTQKTDNDQPIVNYLIDNDVDVNTITNATN
ncbi:MAG: hypothetical protein ABI199_08960 [Bacteroidia bacterium]